MIIHPNCGIVLLYPNINCIYSNTPLTEISDSKLIVTIKFQVLQINPTDVLSS